MIRALTRVSVAALASLTVVVGGLASPAQAASPWVELPSSSTLPLGSGCVKIPIRIQPPSEAIIWGLETKLNNKPMVWSSGKNSRTVTDSLIHCAISHGVGKFDWTATLSWSADDVHWRETVFSSSYTIHKTKRTGKLTISDRTPKFGQGVKIRICIPGPRDVDFHLQIKSGKKTSVHLDSTGVRSCAPFSIKWPKSKKPMQFRLIVPGDEASKKYTGKWVIVRGHA